MLPPVYNVLRAAPAVVDLVGTRIWKHGVAPQDDVALAVRDGLAFVTWFLVTATPENTLSELPSKDRATIQVDCFIGGRDGSSRITTLAEAVRDAIEPHAHLTGTPVDERESATKLWRMALQFDWFVDRPLSVPA